MQTPETKQNLPEEEIESTQYEAPAIIYEGSLGTRAGTPIPDPQDDVDKLFDD